MAFKNEKEFENRLIEKLILHKGWDREILKYPTEEELLQNWANILFENNKEKDRLNNIPLSKTEVEAALQEILHTTSFDAISRQSPSEIHDTLVGETISLKRDVPEMQGKVVTLHIFNCRSIAGGKTRYQIAVQPQFNSHASFAPDRRGDISLLIDGLPLIHIELKKEGVPIANAIEQIKKYTAEDVFSIGLFSCIQVFVAMTPSETLYFANPGSLNNFDSNYYFHWADFYNNPVNDWSQVAEKLLSIPMAHQLISFCTVSDKNDGILKVLRSYQFYQVAGVLAVCEKHDWYNITPESPKGGYVTACTGSGKTLTSFNAAKIIMERGLADNVVFLVDRTELGNQSFTAYKQFAQDSDEIKETLNTNDLINKLASKRHSIIVTSIQKMNRINNDNSKKFEQIRKKRIVIIIDECHRSTFGEMFSHIIHTFPASLCFGFTGTPIFKENNKKSITTSDIFGNEIHCYNIADGIRDGNVLRFDIRYKNVIDMDDARDKIGRKFAGIPMNMDINDVKNPDQLKIYYSYLDKNQFSNEDVEKELCKNSQYQTEKYREAVVSRIKRSWNTNSKAGKFHALFATASIEEAIEYYSLFKNIIPELRVTALFDAHDDESSAVKTIKKEKAIQEIINDYNAMYKTRYRPEQYYAFKKDVCERFSHKKNHRTVNNKDKTTVNLVIVVNQLLTGFDSKWLNTLYVDRNLENEYIIQAFSRTNRLFGAEKPSGIIEIFRCPYKMKKNVDAALKLYCKGRELEMFAPSLDKHIKKINSLYEEICDVFKNENIQNFNCLPKDDVDLKQFVKLFSSLRKTYNAAKFQGFEWNNKKVKLDEKTYNRLFELYHVAVSCCRTKKIGIPYDIDISFSEFDNEVIDKDYMDRNFKRYIELSSAEDKKEKNRILNALHNNFGSLNTLKQRAAELILHDIDSGILKLKKSKSFTDYLLEYSNKMQNDAVLWYSKTFELNADKIIDFISKAPDETALVKMGIDDFARTADLQKTIDYFSQKEKTQLVGWQAQMMLLNQLTSFIVDSSK